MPGNANMWIVDGEKQQLAHFSVSSSNCGGSVCILLVSRIHIWLDMFAVYQQNADVVAKLNECRANSCLGAGSCCTAL